MKGKFTEHSLRVDLINKLKEKLGSEYIVAHEISIRKEGLKIRLGSKRTQIDLVIFKKEFIIDINEDLITWNDSRAVSALIDTKNKGEKIDRYRTTGQIFTYMMNLNSNLAFSTNYKEIQSYHLVNDRLRDYQSFNSIEEIVTWILNIIREHEGGIPHQLPIKNIVENLKGYINDLFKNLTETIDFRDIEVILKIKNLEDDSLYKNNEEKIQTRYRGGAFLCLSQILFYIILRQSRINLKVNLDPKLPNLSICNGVPDQIQKQFDLIYNEINYQSIFEFRILPKLPDSFSGIFDKIIKSIEGISEDIIIQNDLIGVLFQQLIPLEMRKKLAAYYTKSNAAKLLASFLIEDGEETVLDPACGSGTLLTAIYNAKRNKMGLKFKHSKALDEIYGSDISVFATILASVNLAIQDTRKWTNNVNIFNEDAFKLYKSDIQKYFKVDIERENYEQQTPKGLKKVFRSGLSADIVIMNPPFTKASRLTEKERKILLALSKTYGLKHGWKTWSLFASFILLSPKYLDLEHNKTRNSRIGMVLPLSSIESTYMVKVWKSLFKNTKLGIKLIIKASTEEVSFSDSSEHEILVVLEEKYKDICKLIQLNKSIEDYEFENLFNNINEVNKSNINDFQEDFICSIYNQKKIKEFDSTKWSFESRAFLSLIQRDFVNLVEYDGLDVYAGNSGKPKDAFWIPNDYWIIKEVKSDKITLTQNSNLKNLVNSLKNLSSINRIDIENYINGNDSGDLNENEFVNNIPMEQMKLFLKLTQSQIKKFINLKEEIAIECKFLNKSFKNSITFYYDEAPLLSEYIDFDYYVNYRKLPQNHIYYEWCEILKTIVNSWVPYNPTLGEIFIPVKIRLNTMKTIAFKTCFIMESARTMGIVIKRKKIDEYSEIQLNILFAYLTSSLFLYDFCLSANTLSEAYKTFYVTRFREYKFPDLTKINEEQFHVMQRKSKYLKVEKTIKKKKIVFKK